MVAYTKPQQRKKEESEQLRGERDKIKFIDRRFERWQVVGLRRARRRLKKEEGRTERNKMHKGDTALERGFLVLDVHRVMARCLF